MLVSLLVSYDMTWWGYGKKIELKIIFRPLCNHKFCNKVWMVWVERKVGEEKKLCIKFHQENSWNYRFFLLLFFNDSTKNNIFLAFKKMGEFGKKKNLMHVWVNDSSMTMKNTLIIFFVSFTFSLWIFETFACHCHVFGWSNNIFSYCFNYLKCSIKNILQQSFNFWNFCRQNF